MNFYHNVVNTIVVKTLCQQNFSSGWLWVSTQNSSVFSKFIFLISASNKKDETRTVIKWEQRSGVRKDRDFKGKFNPCDKRYLTYFDSRKLHLFSSNLHRFLFCLLLFLCSILRRFTFHNLSKVDPYTKFPFTTCYVIYYP